MSIVFGRQSRSSLGQYQSLRRCHGCLFVIDEPNDERLIYTVIVDTKRRLSFLYNTCLECEKQSQMKWKAIKGYITLYCGNELVCQKPIKNITSTQFEILKHLVQPILPKHELRATDREHCLLLNKTLSPDLLHLVQSFL
jgi:hypothetical protein